MNKLVLAFLIFCTGQSLAQSVKEFTRRVKELERAERYLDGAMVRLQDDSKRCISSSLKAGCEDFRASQIALNQAIDLATAKREALSRTLNKMSR